MFNFHFFVLPAKDLLLYILHGHSLFTKYWECTEAFTDHIQTANVSLVDFFYRSIHLEISTETTAWKDILDF